MPHPLIPAAFIGPPRYQCGGPMKVQTQRKVTIPMSNLFLDHRTFRRFALTFAVSRAGDFLLSVAMVVFVYQKTGPTSWVAAAAIARLIPHVLFSAVGGSLGDRFGRRFLVASDLA